MVFKDDRRLIWRRRATFLLARFPFNEAKKFTSSGTTNAVSKPFIALALLSRCHLDRNRRCHCLGREREL